MPRTLLLTPDFPPSPGGVARYLEVVAYALKDEVTVFASPEPSVKAVDLEASYKIVRTPLLYKNIWPRWLCSVVLLCRQAKAYDRVVVSHLLPFGVAALVARAFTKKPYVLIVHGLDISLALRSGWKQKLARIVVRNADLVVANSIALKDELQSIFSVDRIAYVHPSFSPRVLTSSRPLSHHGIRLLTVARLVPRKGHLRVLEALARLRREGRAPADLSYMIVGDGVMKEEIERRVVELGLTDCVHLRTDVSDEELPNFYQSSDLFVMPTAFTKLDREGFGIVYLEAAAFGLPSIATHHAGVDEAVLDGSTGLLIPDGDIGALAKAIQTLSTDAALRQKLGAAGKMRVQQEFSRERQVEKIQRLLT